MVRCSYGWSPPCLSTTALSGPWKAACGPTSLLTSSFFRLRLIRIPHVRWSLGFVPELVFGLAFGLGGGSSCGGSLFGPVGKAYFAPLLRAESMWLCRVHGNLADASKNKKGKYIYIYIYIHTQIFNLSTHSPALQYISTQCHVRKFMFDCPSTGNLVAVVFGTDLGDDGQ